MREEANSNTSRNVAASSRSPWSFTRHLPESNDVEELRRFANRISDELYQLRQETSTVSSQVLSNIPQTTSATAGALNASALIPAWTKTIAPPFAVLACNADGSLQTDSRGYGYIRKVL